MVLFDWLKNKLFPKIMTNKLFEQGAFHESGHIAMAYLTRFKSDEVGLLPNNPGSGFTRFDYGDQRITLLIAAMQNYSQDPSIYNDLDYSLKAVTSQVAFKICGTLLGGPVSEAFYKSGIDFDGDLPIEMSGPDLLSVQNIDLCLSCNVANHDPNYITTSLTNVVNLIRQPECWMAIEHLASTILTSPTKHLYRQQIENSLLASGYMTFIK